MNVNRGHTLMEALARATLLLALAFPFPLHSQPYATPPTWGGDLSSRPRLTGDWGGTRDAMAKKGVVLDVDTYWMPQKVVGGGKNSGGGGWGNAIATLNVDTQKAGLWPGGFFNIQTVTGFGHSAYRSVGAIVPANEAWLLPRTRPDTGLQSFTFMQFLSKQFGLVVGKLNLLETTNQFFGDYRTGFLNTGINFPMALDLVPLSAFGAGALYLPSKDLKFSALVLDPSGTITGNNLGDAFDNGVMALATGEIKIKLFELPGHQNLTLGWSDKTRLSLTQDPSNLARLLATERFPRLGDAGPVFEEIIERKAPGLLVPIQPLNKENTTWVAVYGFEQFLWQPGGDPKHGVGMFFNFGASDGRANPIKDSYSLGFVGKGVIPGRPGDDIGIGWSRSKFSDRFVPFLRHRYDLGLDREDAIELYYNAALTPWLSVSPSLQVIYSGMDRVLGSDRRASFRNLDTTYLAGVRLGIRF